jgi:hypothetical protein
MPLSSSDRQKKFIKDREKKGMIRVSFWVNRKEWERFKKYQSKNIFPTIGDFIVRINKILASIKFKP